MSELPQELNSYRTGPDENGHFGIFGGRFVAETLMPLILDLEQNYKSAQQDPAFYAELDDLAKHYTGRPSPLYFAERLTEHCGGAKIYFKRDELNHTGSHKINNCLGQIQLARRMGKTRIIAETGAGQHGVATPQLQRASVFLALFTWEPKTLNGSAQCVPHETTGCRSGAGYLRRGHAQRRDE